VYIGVVSFFLIHAAGILTSSVHRGRFIFLIHAAGILTSTVYRGCFGHLYYWYFGRIGRGRG